jgi:hypothetical protein
MDARRQVARWLRIEASIYAQQQLTEEQRALLPGVLLDVGDLAVLAASMRLEREQGKGSSAFTEGFGLSSSPKWRSQSRKAFRDFLICQVPTKANKPCARATEIVKALKRHVPAAHEPGHPLSRVIAANGGKRPSFSVMYRIFSNPRCF